MVKKLPYHILNTLLIGGGVGFMMNMLNLVDFLLNVKIYHFLILMGGALVLKIIYGVLVPKVKDPLNTHPLARKFFYLGMGILALALVMRTYHIPYYSWLLYVDIGVQIVALGISFTPESSSAAQDFNDEILDN